MPETTTQRLYKAVNGGFFNGKLPALRVIETRLAGRRGECDLAGGVIRLDKRRAGREVADTLLHECVHAALPATHADPAKWHAREFQRLHSDLRAWFRNIEQRRERKERTMLVPQTARPVEFRRNGLSPTQQLRAIRAWERDHPDMATIPNVRFTVAADGTVTPHFEDAPRLRVADAERRMRNQRSSW